MKLVLQRAGQVIEFSLYGRVVFVRDEAGVEHEQGFFDEAAAASALEDQVATRREAGWLEPAEVVDARARATADATAHAAALTRQREWHRALTEHADAAGAFLNLARASFESLDPGVLATLSAEVVSLREPTEHGVTVCFRNGAEADWRGDEVSVFARRSEREEWPPIEYAVTSGPPLDDAEVEGEVNGDITWFMNESIYRYWFFTSDEPNRARKWEHDGGIEPDPVVRSPTQAFAELLLEFVCQR